MAAAVVGRGRLDTIQQTKIGGSKVLIHERFLRDRVQAMLAEARQSGLAQRSAELHRARRRANRAAARLRRAERTVVRLRGSLNAQS